MSAWGVWGPACPARFIRGGRGAGCLNGEDRQPNRVTGDDDDACAGVGAAARSRRTRRRTPRADPGVGRRKSPIAQKSTRGPRAGTFGTTAITDARQRAALDGCAVLPSDRGPEE